MSKTIRADDVDAMARSPAPIPIICLVGLVHGVVGLGGWAFFVSTIVLAAAKGYDSEVFTMAAGLVALAGLGLKALTIVCALVAAFRLKGKGVSVLAVFLNGVQIAVILELAAWGQR